MKLFFTFEVKKMIDEIRLQVKTALEELFKEAKLEKGDLVVIGCSTSEVMGQKVGTYSTLDVGRAIADVAYELTKERGLYLAAQCCEHLNRAVIVEREAARLWGLERVNAKPQLHAGGAFAMSVWDKFSEPCAVEKVSAAAGLDIGGVLIGMQLRPVAVPVRTSVDMIGKARLTVARTRPKFVGGERALYVDELR